MQDNPIQPSRKPVILIITCILAIIIVGVGTAILLRTLTITKDESGGQQANAPSPAQIVKTYAEPNIIKALAEPAFSTQSNATSEGMVIYKSDGNTYAVDTPTQETALFHAKDPSVADATNAVQEQTAEFMQAKGYEKTENSAGLASENPSYATYQSSGAVCQLASSKANAETKSPAFHKLSCVEKTAIQHEYKTIQALLDLYAKDNKAVEFSEAMRSNRAEGNKSLTILSLSDDKKATLLLFAAIDREWEYVGNLSDSETASNGKYTISPAARQAIDDPKWGDFLKKNIQ